MPTFQELLSRALRSCNRHGTVLSAGVIVWGICLLLVQLLLWRQITGIAAMETRRFVGDDQYAQIRQTVEKPAYSASDIDDIATFVLTHGKAKMGAMKAFDRNAYAAAMAIEVAKEMIPPVAAFGSLLILLQLLSKAYFLVVVARKTESADRALRRLLRSFPALLWTWILMGALSLLWLPFLLDLFVIVWPDVVFLSLLAFVPVLFLLPRFLFAPIILLQEGKGPMQSMRLSYRRTRGRWKWIVLQMLGVMGVLWIFATFAGALFDGLVSAVAQYSPLAVVLYWLGIFLALATLAYRLAFTVELKEAIDAHHVAHS